MTTVGALASILAVLIVGIISPGPSFLLVAQTAVSRSRRAAVASALGMALGATLLCILALLGLQALIQQFPAVYMTVKVIGATYLIYLAVSLWRGASREFALTKPEPERRSPSQHFAVALGVMLTNPKAAVQYGILFGTFMPQNPPPILSVLLPIAVFLLEAGWYIFVAVALSAPQSRASYLGAKRYIDRIAGVFLGAMGLRLLASK